jgi:olfactory receptor
VDPVRLTTTFVISTLCWNLPAQAHISLVVLWWPTVLISHWAVFCHLTCLLHSYTGVSEKAVSRRQRKTLSTCGAHIAVVIIFFDTCAFTYTSPDINFTEDKVVAVFYTIIMPMLNLTIYTLRNAEIKNAMKKLWIRKLFWDSNMK